MQTTVAEIRKIAEKVRLAFEERLIPQDTLSQLYSKYAPEVDAEMFVLEAEKLFPRLNCGLATVYLQEVLGEGEIMRGMYRNNNHTFLLLEEERIVVDITADQYGGPKVYVRAFTLPWAKK